MLFQGSKQECETLVSWLNSLYPWVITYKYEYSTEIVEFLDLQIMLENGKIETNLFIKPSNLQLYLDYFSNHPEDSDLHLENLKRKLMKRNCPEKIIDEKF